MSYDVNKKATVGQVKTLAQKVKSDFATKAEVTTALAGKADAASVPAKVSDLTNDSGFQTAEQVESAVTGKGYQTAEQVSSAISSAVSAVYKAKGSVAFADLPQPGADTLGFVYNVTDAFTTTDRFVEGAGKAYPAGTNVVVAEPAAGTYLLDVLSGFIDMSGFLTGDDVATDEEFSEMLAEVFA